MKTILRSAGLLLVSFAAQAQCEAVATLNENFTNFTTGTSALPQNCWNKIAAGYPSGLVYADATDGNNYAVYYGAGGNGAQSYLIAPETNTFDGAHQLSFTTWKLAQGGTVPEGTVTVTLGTITDVADATTFIPFGDAITIDSGTPVTIENIIIPSAAAGSHIAWRFSTTNQHNAVAIDNVVWDAVPTPACQAVTALNEDFSNFTTGTAALPQNCWDKIAPGYPNGLVYADTADGNNYAVYYGANGTGALSYLVGPEVSTFDGAHQLAFTTWKIAQGGTVPSGTVTITVGTITDVTDGTTFVPFGDALTVDSGTPVTFDNLVIPSAAAGSHIAWRFSTTNMHNAVAIDNVIWDEVPAAECAAVATFTEDFASFTTSTAFPYNCWSANAGAPPSGPMIYVAAEGSVTYYAGSNNTTPAYLISPEVSTIDGAHQLSFDATIQGAAATLQLGYITGETGTFTAVGDPISITAANSTFSNIVFPAITENAHIAFSFTSAAPHQAVVIDNVSWTPVTNSYDNFSKKAFTLYPNPASGSVNLVNNANAEGTVNIYTLAGAKVYSANIGTGNQNLNLSALQAGMYLVQVQSGNAVSTQKLVIK